MGAARVAQMVAHTLEQALPFGLEGEADEHGPTLTLSCLALAGR